MIWFWIIGAIVILFGFVAFFGAPYVPSQKRYARRAFEQLYKLSPSDVLVDIGSGDGVVLRLAAQKGARAIGYELNPFLVFLARWMSRRYKNIEIILANFWAVQLPDATTVIYSFGVGRDTKKLMKKLQGEADRLGRSLTLLSLGHELPMGATRSFEAYHLYTFYPLQPPKAQV